MKSNSSTATTPRQRRVRALRRSWHQLQDHLLLNVYGGISREDIDRYSDQPDTLAGLIALRTGKSRQTVRAWLTTALAPWRPA